MRTRAQSAHVAGWTGGLLERAEPDRAAGEILGRLRSGENFVHSSTGRLAVRGGMREAMRATLGSVTELTGVFPWSPTGGLVIGHAPVTPRHYVYAVGEDGGYALPSGSETETDSRADLDWDTATAVWPQSEELFETLFLCDPTQAQGLRSVKLTGGSLAVAPVEADLNADAVNGVMRPAGLFQFNSVLFAFGWEDETVGIAPEILRHSYLGQDPAAVAGWDADAFALIGAKGQPITAGAAGQGSALVAKRSGLWRITGTPDALPGWQFAVQAVDSSQGYGVTNPNALVYAYGRWWGIARTGPWFSDGNAPVSLVGSRRERWGQVSRLDTAAWVAAHPTREAILFGFSEPSSMLAGEQASRLWVFDAKEDRWAPDWTFPNRFWRGFAIEQTGLALATVPQNVAWVSTAGAVESRAASFSFDPADPTAQTEVWLQASGSPSTLVATLPAGLKGARLAGLAPGRGYELRLRHRKGDSLTEFATTVSLYTVPDHLRFNGPQQAGYQVTGFNVANDVPAGTIAWGTTIASASYTGQLANVAEGSVLVPFDFSWPASATPLIGAPASVTAVAPTNAIEAQTGPSSALRLQPGLSSSEGFGITQLLDGSNLAESSATLLVCFSQNASFGVGLFTMKITLTAIDMVGTYESETVNVRGKSTQLITITGLPASMRFTASVTYSRVNNNGTLSADPSLTAYTKIAAPTVAGTVLGTPGNPRVDFTVTPPSGRTGFDIAIRNADGSFDALYSSVSDAPATYSSTEGTEGRPDRYWVRGRRLGWPEGARYSDPVEVSISSPVA